MAAATTYASHAWDPVGRPEQTATLHEWCRLMDVQIAALSSLVQGGSAFLTQQTTNPTTTFITPLVQNTTSSSGGLYAWDGTQYQKVALATT